MCLPYCLDRSDADLRKDSMNTNLIYVLLILCVVSLILNVVIIMMNRDDHLDKQIDDLEKMMAEQKGIIDTMQNNFQYTSRISQETTERLVDMVEGKLNEMRGLVDEKLNTRLDENFRQVGDQLAMLYRSLGELNTLSTGIQDLNKTLTNVKTRGTWGEVQLERILEQTMASNQYAKNMNTKPGSNDRVEFAVILPGNGENMYLPIDSKFPADIYNHIMDASTREELIAARKELRTRILNEAKTIKQKYIEPPYTTDYAVLFLPTEGLYAEVLRINDLAEECQRIGVMLAGPTTITALLNALQQGFRNYELSKKSVEISRLLEAIKAQFNIFDEDMEKTLKKLHEAEEATNKVKKRSDIIRGKMKSIAQTDINASDQLLDIHEEE